ncbi:MAG TPA: anti-sigma factor [Acidobacteriaceae bacterium]|jgi:anti-sigma-K factor RskA|nr:anti-sigma factor [Acidobacteriaceae bacterium]
MEEHVNPGDPDLYALGALDGEEKQAFEAHVRTCAACAEELAAARQRVALLALAAPPAAPSPALKQRLMQRVRAEKATVAVPVREMRRFSFLIPALAACTVFFAVLAGWLWRMDLRDTHRIAFLQRRLASAEARSQEVASAAAETDRLLGVPGTINVALAQQPGQPAGHAGVLYNPRMGTVLYAGQLLPAPPGKSYQLWLVPAQGAPVSLGVFSAKEARVAITAHVSPGIAAKAFAVTIEPQGGMPQPTGPKVLVGVPG